MSTDYGTEAHEKIRNGPEMQSISSTFFSMFDKGDLDFAAYHTVNLNVKIHLRCKQVRKQ